MIALDVALATSGSEAIVESFLFCNGHSEAEMLSIQLHYGVEQRSIGCYHMSETIQSRRNWEEILGKSPFTAIPDQLQSTSDEIGNQKLFT